MRRLLIALAGILTFAAITTSAGAFPTVSPGSVMRGADTTVVQVHSGPRACHWVRGRWWRDTRPYSTPGCRRGHRGWHHHHYWHRHVWWQRHVRWHRHHW